MWVCFGMFTLLQTCLGFRALAGLFFGEDLMAPRGSGSAPPTFLVCPVESREPAVLCPLLTTLHSKDGAPEGSSQQQGL